MHIADNVRAGMSPEEARRQALIALGGVEQTKERYREGRRIRWLDELSRTRGSGFARSSRIPGVTIIAALSLALATGATRPRSSASSTASLLRPLPFGEPSRLVQIAETVDAAGRSRVASRQSHAFESFAEYSPVPRNLHTSVERRAHHRRSCPIAACSRCWARNRLPGVRFDRTISSSPSSASNCGARVSRAIRM